MLFKAILLTILMSFTCAYAQENYLLVEGYVYRERISLRKKGESFPHLQKMLKEDFHVGEEHIREIGYPHKMSIFQSAHQLERMLTRAMKSGRVLPLVIYAHSMGSIITLLAVTQNPELLTSGFVKRIIVLHGALGGSQVANAVTAMAFALDPLFASRSVSANLMLLQEGVSKDFLLKQISKLSSEQRQSLDQKLFYVRGKRNCEEIPGIFEYTCKYLRQFGENDGLVLAKDQMLEGIGTDLGVFAEEHDAPLWTNTVTGAEQRERHKGLLQKILNQ